MHIRYPLDIKQDNIYPITRRVGCLVTYTLRDEASACGRLGV